MDSASPESRNLALPITLGHGFAVTAALVAVYAAVSAVLMALAGSPPTGVVADEAPGRVVHVTPGGFAWGEGIRPDQQVLAEGSADEGGGWFIETVDAGGAIRRAELAGAGAKLRASSPMALLALGLGMTALLRSHRRPRVAAATAALSIAAAALPASVVATTAGAAAVLVAALLLPAAWLAVWAPIALRLRLALVLGAIVFVAAWVYARIGALPAFDVLESGRVALTIAITCGVGLVLLRDGRVRVRDAFDDDRAWLVDVVSVVTAATASFLLLALAHVPPILLLVLAAAAAVLYPRFRTVLVRFADRMFFSDLRRRLQAEAIEDERARLARELHDTPMQELAGVIRRLELIPGARAEGDALRGVADHMRTIATQLHPPVLDDYGLGPALHFLMDVADGSPADPRISIEVTNTAGTTLDARPPREVESAVFRIMQEALNNALTHADAENIRLIGTITPASVDLTLEDDGKGLSSGTLESARQSGHLGVVSMRQRADLVGARLRLNVAPDGGTTLRVTWTR